MRTNALFLVTLVCGTILVILLSILISSRSPQPGEVPSVMYFAMYLGDEDGEKQPYGLVATSERKSCSFYLEATPHPAPFCAKQRKAPNIIQLGTIFEKGFASDVLALRQIFERSEAISALPGGT
ncbi:hypothetical protein Y032_0193g1405 [Ancylostoma ceylanicum]|nr:hypothetical protein Y032_0193g1405 [Ancylostoma ceylanicum]